MSPCRQWPFDDPDDGHPTWRTEDGRKITYHDLSDRHLDNIINYLEHQLSGAWSFSSTLRGEMAIDAMDDAISGLENVQQQMLSERERRKDSKVQVMSNTAIDWESYGLES